MGEYIEIETIGLTCTNCKTGEDECPHLLAWVKILDSKREVAEWRLLHYHYLYDDKKASFEFSTNCFYCKCTEPSDNYV